MEFSGKVVLITGASAGIGAATANKFAELGANLAIVGRKMENLSKFAQSLDQFKGGKVVSFFADISKEEDVKRIVDETIAEFGKLDVLVNNAGFGKRHGILDGIKPYDDVMATNVRRVYMLTSLAAHLIKTKGNIVNVSSVASQIPSSKSIPYRISKAALDMVTKCVALDLAPYGVRVNSVNPSYTKTNMVQAMGLNKEQSDAFYVTAAKGEPLKRVSDINEIADMIVHLASDKARGMTGSITLVLPHIKLASVPGSAWANVGLYGSHILAYPELNSI